MEITPYQLAQRFVGLKEVPGPTANPQVLAMLQLDSKWPEDDAVPWCAGFVNYICWLLRLPRSKSLRARSFLNVGVPVRIGEAQAGFDVVILSRGSGNQPGPSVIDAPGHVGFYAGQEGRDGILILGGNQGNQVSIGNYKLSRVLGIRRLA